MEDPVASTSTGAGRQLDRLLWVTVLAACALLAQADDGARLVVRPTDTAVEVNKPVSFFCRADGNPLPAIRWLVNGRPLNNPRFVAYPGSRMSVLGGLGSLRVEPVSASDNNSVVTCTADNGQGSPAVSKAKLIVYSSEGMPSGFPVVDAHPMLRSVEKGWPAHVQCKVRGDPSPNVLWLRNKLPIDVQNNARYSIATLGNPASRQEEAEREYRFRIFRHFGLHVEGSLIIQNASEIDQGEYECIAKNKFGAAHSRSAHLYVKVRRVPPYFTIPPKDSYKVGPGGAINISCTAMGYPMPKVFWRREPLTMLEDPEKAPVGRNILQLNNTQATQNYTCVAVSMLGNIEKMTTVYVKGDNSTAIPADAFEYSDTESLVAFDFYDGDPNYYYAFMNDLPEAPTNVMEVKAETEPRSVTLQWNQVPPAAPDDRIVGYVVEWKAKYTDAQQDYTTAETTATRHRVTGLQPYTLYEFRVLAKNLVGVGKPSLPIDIQTGEDVPEGKPQNVQSRAVTPSSAVVQWSLPEKPNGKITEYTIYYTDDPSPRPFDLWMKHKVAGSGQTAQLTSLNADSTYRVVVQAHNNIGAGPLSEQIYVITSPGIPGQPVNLMARALGPDEIMLTWDQPLTSSPITQYVIQYNSTASMDSNEKVTDGADRSFVVSRLRPDTAYSFKVAARSVRGTGAFSSWVHRSTLPSVPTVAPRGVRVVAEGADALRVSWQRPPADAARNISSYLLTYRLLREDYGQKTTAYLPPAPTTPAYDWRGQPVATEVSFTLLDDLPEGRDDGLPMFGGHVITADTQHTLTQLAIWSRYRVTVAAGTATGYGPASPPLVVMTGESVPSAPRDVHAQPINATSIQVSWKAPAEPNGLLAGHYIFTEELQPGSNELVPHTFRRAKTVRPATLTQTTLTGLKPNTPYLVRVAAFNRAGDGEQSNPKVVETTGLPPSAPRHVSAIALDPAAAKSAYNIQVSWTEPEQLYGQPVTRYQIQYKADGDRALSGKEVGADQRSTVIDNLFAGKLYTFHVSAHNADGASDNETVQVRTPDSKPDGPPRNIRFSSSGDRQLRFVWDPPSQYNSNGEIIAYAVTLTDADNSASVKQREYMDIQVGAIGEVEFTKDDLEAGRRYKFQVAARTRKGLGPYSEPITAMAGSPTC